MATRNEIEQVSRYLRVAGCIGWTRRDVILGIDGGHYDWMLGPRAHVREEFIQRCIVRGAFWLTIALLALSVTLRWI